MRRRRCGPWGLGIVLLAGCLGGPPPGPTGRVAVSVAPLNLSGLTNADYTLTVTNGPNGTGAVVWTRAVTSAQYGDATGSLSYVGSCDAATGVNTVTLELTALYDANGVVPAASYMNPTPITRQALCVNNADVAVAFDITLARQADQGFFDVAVQFKDLFCSAKLDCQDAQGGDLELLHNAAGARDLTVVLGFACTGSLTGTTYLYLDDPVIHCTGLAQDVRVDPTGLGNVVLATAPSANASGYLFAASVYRGVEGFAGKAYWNLSFGLDATTFAAAGTCALTTRATASDVAFPQQPGGFPLPAGSVYPVIDWQVTLSDATHRVCTTHEVNQVASGVATNYLGYLPLFNGFTWSAAPVYLKHRFEPASGLVLSAGTPICNPSCAHGVCTATDVCACAGTGYEGPTCATPQCLPTCANGGTCTAPDTCSCPAGFWGPTCASACGAVAHCAVTPTCTGAADAVCPTCASGFLPDGAGGCVACLGAGDCAADASDCTVAACEAGVCVQNPLGAGASCGDPGSACVVQDTCDGSGACTDNGFASAGTACGSPSDTVCDGADRCDGAGACLTNYASAATVCRASAGVCDLAERCDGSGACPADGHVANGTACSNGLYCDGAETCSDGSCVDNADPCDASTSACVEATDTCVPAFGSCLGWRTAGYTTSGLYPVDPDGSGGPLPASTVWCDMTTDGGGYTFLKVQQGSAHTAAQAEAWCDTLGMQLFIPRTRAHLLSAWQVATGTDLGPDASDAYLAILGIYPKTVGATCASTPLAYGNPSCAWAAGDGGTFWVSDGTGVGQPSGDNALGGSLSYVFDGSGNAASWDDTPAGHASTRFLCDVGDKDVAPANCLAWSTLGFVTSGSYAIDPDGAGAGAPVMVTCDMVADGGGWTQLNASLVTLQVNKGSAHWSGSDLIGTGQGTDCGVNPRQYTLANPTVTYSSVSVLLTRTTSILQCSSIGHASSGWYTPPYTGAFTPNGVCTWDDGVFANVCCNSENMTGLKLNWVLKKTGLNAPLYYNTQCSAPDVGAFTMRWFVR